MKIRKIFKEHECCPIKWFAELEDGSLITIRERMNELIVYKEAKSIFSVKDEDVLLYKDVDISGVDEVLNIAVKELDIEFLPGALNYLNKLFDEYRKNDHNRGH